jgi:hypothetical protein
MTFGIDMILDKRLQSNGSYLNSSTGSSTEQKIQRRTKLALLTSTRFETSYELWRSPTKEPRDARYLLLAKVPIKPYKFGIRRGNYLR